MDESKNSNCPLEDALLSSKFMLICQLRYEVKNVFQNPRKEAEESLQLKGQTTQV